MTQRVVYLDDGRHISVTEDTAFNFPQKTRDLFNKLCNQVRVRAHLCMFSVVTATETQCHDRNVQNNVSGDNHNHLTL